MEVPIYPSASDLKCTVNISLRTLTRDALSLSHWLWPRASTRTSLCWSTAWLRISSLFQDPNVSPNFQHSLEQNIVILWWRWETSDEFSPFAYSFYWSCLFEKFALKLINARCLYFLCEFFCGAWMLMKAIWTFSQYSFVSFNHGHSFWSTWPKCAD